MQHNTIRPIYRSRAVRLKVISDTRAQGRVGVFSAFCEAVSDSISGDSVAAVTSNHDDGNLLLPENRDPVIRNPEIATSSAPP
jgi:hypothetical protein